MRRTIALLVLQFCVAAAAQQRETLPPLVDDQTPVNFSEMWAGFDPRAEPLEVETLHEWEEENTVLRIVRFRIGVFKGQVARLAAVYGHPKTATATSQQQIPGLLQIHGGGQYADYKACLRNAQRGYATLSIAWAGRISAPKYNVNPDVVKLFWDDQTDSPAYRITTDWGAVDGYHAPGRNPGNAFPSAKAAAWTLDTVESPRNSGWFLCALAARRALTFLEQQPEVNPDKLGVYGHSMGGKLTVMASVDARIKAAAPSCGGISDRTNDSPLFRSTLADDVSLQQVSCPIIFLSPANDFHGRISDLPKAVNEIRSSDWRVTCAPHHNHQDTPPFEAATLLWFDQHLRHDFEFPQTPETDLKLRTSDGVPTLLVKPDSSKPIESIDVFYTQHGRVDDGPEGRENTMSRFWHHAAPLEVDGLWEASLPVSTIDRPLWVYANVLYKLSEPVSGAGYYYRTFTTDTFNLSSMLTMITADELAAAGVKATRERSYMIETFATGWGKEWFTYKVDDWGRTTHKLYDAVYAAPPGVKLQLDVKTEEPNQLVIMIDDHAATVDLAGGSAWQRISLSPTDFQNFSGEPLATWDGLRRFSLSAAERLKPSRGDNSPSRFIGGNWKGRPPEFRNLSWQATAAGGN